MKNITVSLDNALYERSRVIAAQQRTTVTGLVRNYLTNLAELEQRREQARKNLAEMIGNMGGEVGTMPHREERNAR